VLQCISFSVLQCFAVCCSVLQRVAVCCSVLQYVAACCSVCIPHYRGEEDKILIQHQRQMTAVQLCFYPVKKEDGPGKKKKKREFGKTLCTTLIAETTHCNPLQPTTTYCNILQHTATHCNILQHKCESPRRAQRPEKC